MARELRRPGPRVRDRLQLRGGGVAGHEPDLSRDDHIIVKRRDSAFQDTELDLWLRSSYVDTIICTGVDTAICVENTLEDAFNIGYDVILIDDATASSWQKIGQASVRKVAGSYGWVVGTDRFIDVLNQCECGSGRFWFSGEYL